MKFSKLFCVLLMCIVGYANATVTPITLTGFNADVVANGIGAASASTTHDVDSGGYAFLSPDYQLTGASSLPTKYLPGSGLINSVNTSGISFQLAAYTGLNCLRLQTTSSGTLTFGTPTVATILYVLGFSGSGSSTATITVKFSDNSTQVFSNVTFGDWYGGAGYAIGDVGRVVRSTGATDFAQTTGPRLYEMPLALNASNFSKQIVSVTVARTGGSAGNSILNIMGITTSDATFAGGNYTINSGMPTAGTNFQSFTDAVTALKSGAITGAVTFDVAAGSGPYNERITIPNIPGASSTSRVTFMCNGVTMTNTISDATNRAAILLNGADFITFDSLTIDVSTGTYGWGVALMGQADSNIIRNCTINVSTSNTTSGNHYGIVFNGSSGTTATSGNNANGNLFQNNIISGGYYNVYAYGNSASTTQNINNSFVNCAFKEAYSYSIYAIYQSSGLVISRCDITRPTRTASTTAAGIYLTTGCSGALIEKNRIHNMFDAITTNTSTIYGIYDAADGTATAPNRIVNNIIYNIKHNGAIYGIYNSGAAYMQAYHNTLSIDYTPATAGAVYGFYQITSDVGIEFKNNIITITRGGTGVKYCFYKSTATTAIAASNNVYYLGSAGTGAQSIGYQSSAIATLSAWQTATSQDAGSVAIDPAYVNLAGDDFTPSAASINDIGATGLGVTTDINGVTRTTNPDPGAIEFSLAGCTNPPTAGSAVSSTANVCVNTSFTLDLTGNDVGTGLTFTWQKRKTTTASWSNLGTTATASLLTLTQDTSYYYRCALQCSGGTVVYSTEIQVTSPVLVSGNFTINSGQPTSGSNFQTFADAINYIGCGINAPVVFDVVAGSGPYSEQVTLPAIKGTSITNTVTINGNGATISYNTSDAANRTALILNGTDHVVIDSLTIDVTAGTYGWGIALIGQADSNIIRKCTVNTSLSSTATNYVGIAINGVATTTATSGNNGNGNLIENNTVNGGYYGIYLYGSTAPYNKRNIIRSNNVKEYYLYGIYSYGQDSIVITKNDISRPNRASVSTNYSIYTSSTTHFLVQKNRIHNLFGGAITSSSSSYPIYNLTSGVSATEPSVIENNLIYGVNNGAGLIYGVYSASYNYVNIYHNTIVLDDAAATAGATYGIYAYGTGVNVKNNNVVIARGGSGAKYCIYTGTGTFTTSNNNNLLNTSTTGTNGAVYYSSTGYSTLSAWQASNSNAFDQQSLSVDPVFASPASDDYKPTTSLLDNKGTSVNTLTDILDSTRSTTVPDIGAYEFSTLVAGLNFGAESLVSPVFSSKGCYTDNETVIIKIRNKSTIAHNFVTNPVTVNVNITGTITQTLSATVNTGTLASDSTMNVTLSTSINMTTAGSYVFNASTSLSGDGNSTDDAMPEASRTKVTLATNVGSVTPVSYCISGGTPTLSLPNATGNTNIKWLSSTSSSTGYSDIVGATVTPYTLTSAINQTMYYKAVVGCGSFVDTSLVLTVELKNPLVISTTPATRCGSGIVNIGAIPSTGATVNWFSSASGGASLGSGNSFTTPTLNTTTTYYAEPMMSGGTTTAPLVITEMDLGTDDRLEIQNVSGANIDVTGWRVIISNSYTDINSVNANIQTLTGTMTAGEIKTWTDNSAGPNYWGSNILWNPGASPTYSGWAMILDNSNNIVDVVFLNWSSSAIQASAIVVGGNTLSIGSKWSGNGIDQTSVSSAQSVSRKGVFDNDNSSDFEIVNLTIGATNASMSLPFNGFDCIGTRVAVVATIDTSAGCGGAVPVTITKFKGERLTDKNNLLTWTTSTEINNKGFELERSADGINFSSIVFIPSLSNNGNSSTQLTYSYNDFKPLIANNYYRLKQVDRDGKFAYSQIVLIKGSKVKDIVISNLFPNPTKDLLKLQIESPVNENVSLLITDLSGKTVLNRVYQLQNGTNSYSLPISNLSNGTYLLRLICSSGCEKQILKFVKQ